MIIHQPNLSVNKYRKGILLAGGSGSRFYPLTLSTPKQLLPINKVPAIFYPISILMLSGIRDILIITTPDAQSIFQKLLGDGKQYGINFAYAVQPSPDGIAQSLLIASGSGFINHKDNPVVILGDNLFYGDEFFLKLQNAVCRNTGATIFSCSVPNPERFGVIEFSENGKAASIEEKPYKPKSNYVVTGLYLFDDKAVDLVRTLKPSARGELEITDLNQLYLKLGLLNVETLGERDSWFHNCDIASFKQAEKYVEAIESENNTMIASLEEVAFAMGLIDETQFGQTVLSYRYSEYGRYLSQCRDRYISGERVNLHKGSLNKTITQEYVYDAFISHAVEDKQTIVQALSGELTKLGFKIWYDETELKLGDSLRESIDHAQKKSRFGIVVLSPNFFAKKWTNYELNSLVAREMHEGKVVIPIHYQVSLGDILNFSPSLGDRFALRIDEKTDIKEAAAEIGNALKV